ncbi:MAG: hypothetical protein IAE87_08530 [Rhodobacteraceae bacterium]|jgi:hypothetical protein|nr:hypothetical protein [Paracoccaceae bacterium]
MTLNRTLAALMTAGALMLPLQPALGETDVSGEPTLKSVDVIVDLSAIENAEAAQFWAALEPDLEAAIHAQVKDTVDPQGSDVVIDVDALRLAEGYSPTTGIATSWLAGTIHQTNDLNPARDGTFDLAVDMKAALPEGAETEGVAPDNPAIYRAMVETFARGVFENLN